MEGSSADDDPMDWDTERVVQELCTDNRTWKLLFGQAVLPDPIEFARALRHNEVDGDTLLTELESGFLISDLGLVKSKHKATFRKIVKQLRSRSSKYKIYHLREKEEDESGEIVELGREDDFAQRKRRLEIERESLFADPSFDLSHEAHSAPLPTEQATKEPAHTDQHDHHATAASKPAGEPARKKRRIAPVSVAPQDVDQMRNIPTGLVIETRQESHPLVETHPSEAYLGESGLTRPDIFDVDLDEETQQRVDEKFEALQYHVPAARRYPPGRQRQVNHVLKSRLLRGRQPAQFRRFKADMMPGADDLANDEIIGPLSRDSEDPLEYDSDTWEEILEEQREREVAVHNSSGLKKEEVNAIIDEIIAEYESMWQERKLPKLERTANRVWNDMRRFVGLKRALDREQRDLESYTARLAAMREDIAKEDWVNKADVKRIMGTFEATVEDRQKAIWMLDLLRSPVEPPKPPRLQRKDASKPRGIHSVPEADEEILTSDTEDDLDNFIVDDSQELSEGLVDPYIKATHGLAPIGPHVAASNEMQDSTMAEVGDQKQPVDHVLPTSNANGFVAGSEAAPVNALGEGVEMIDLTPKGDLPSKAPLLATPSRSQPTRLVIDLITPTPSKKNLSETQRTSARMKRTPKIGLSALTSSPIFDKELLQSLNETQAMILEALRDIDPKYRLRLYPYLDLGHDYDVWSYFVIPNLEGEVKGPPFKDANEKNNEDQCQKFVARTILRIFEIYTDGIDRGQQVYKILETPRKNAIVEKEDSFNGFQGFMHSLLATLDAYQKKSRRSTKKATDVTETNGSQRTQSASSRSLKGRFDSVEDIFDLEPDESPTKKYKKVVRDRQAQDLRDSDRLRVAEQEQRRQLLRAKLAAMGPSSLSQKSRFIINETKQDDEGFIYVPDNIAARIKDHQVGGVRFMWNHLVVDAQSRQGCLLAHTMGLGKTMQVITLLCTIADAAASNDPSISSQIPEDLRKSITLVLAPPGLVNNWMDEFLLWSPDGHRLGSFFKIDADTPAEERPVIVHEWAAKGGILIVGYALFKTLSNDEITRDELQTCPNIVIADEAHMLKNPDSQVHIATANFSTRNRIAMTGSPLANNVMEYYWMINWVAPKYLSNVTEFRADYASPIEDGMSADSTWHERRKALTKLRALKQTVAPKVQRRTIAALKNNIPEKTEFVVTIPLTDLQRQLYEKYMNFYDQDYGEKSTRLFGHLEILRLICNHPCPFRTRINANGRKGAPVQLPPQLVSEEREILLRVAKGPALDQIEFSWKVVLLMQILNESKKLGDSVLVFTQSLTTLDYLESLFRRQRRSFARLDGKTAVNARQNMVKNFNQAGIDIFLISTTAGGLGLNITGANRVVIFDFKFNPQQEQQAIGRAYRIGQPKPVWVYWLVAGGTFEEKLHMKQIFKMQLAARVVDKKNPLSKARRLDELFTMPTDPPQKDLSPFQGIDKVLDSILQSEEFRLGVRAIVKTDAFEEEDPEDKDLSPEELKEVALAIAQHKARLSGQPWTRPDDDVLSSSTWASNTILPDGSLPSGSADHQIQANGMENPSAQVSSRAHDMSATAPLPQEQSGGTSSMNTSVANIVPPATASMAGEPPQVANQSYENGPLAPIPGASTQVRQPETATHNSSQVFKGELARAFAVNAVDSVRQKRRQVAEQIAAAFGDQGNMQGLQATQLAILDAAKSQRFIEAVVLGILSSDELVPMRPEQVAQRREELDRMSMGEWDKLSMARYFEGDPEHRQTPNPNASTSNVGSAPRSQSRSHKDDDLAVMQALKAGQETGQNGGTFNRLSGWMTNTIGRIASSGPPQTRRSSSTRAQASPTRRIARDPFL